MKSILIKPKLNYYLLLFIILAFNTLNGQTRNKYGFDFKLSDDFFSSQKLKVGVKLHNNTNKEFDDITIKDYILEYKVGKNNNNNFCFDKGDSSDIIVNSSNKKLGRAVINIGFYGCKLKSGKNTFLFKPSVYKVSPSTISFFCDLVNNGFLNSSNINLVVIDVLNPNNNDLYNNIKNNIKLNSRYLFILWDKNEDPELPKALENIEYTITPLAKRNVLKDISNDTTSANHSKISFSGNYTGSVSYEINFFINDKYTTVPSQEVSALDGIYLYGNNNFIKSISIKIPDGFNILANENKYKTTIKNNRFELNINKAINNYSLQIREPADIYFYYLDVNSLSNTRKAILDINDSIKSVISKGDNFLLFVSNGNKPFITSNADDYYNILKKALSIVPDPPTVPNDIRLINKNSNWKTLLETNNNVFLNFYLSENTYQFYKDKLIKNEKNSSNNNSYIEDDKLIDNNIKEKIGVGSKNINVYINADGKLNNNKIKYVNEIRLRDNTIEDERIELNEKLRKADILSQYLVLLNKYKNESQQKEKRNIGEEIVKYGYQIDRKYRISKKGVTTKEIDTVIKKLDSDIPKLNTEINKLRLKINNKTKLSYFYKSLNNK